jgi:hypothetical protein
MTAAAAATGFALMTLVAPFFLVTNRHALWAVATGVDVVVAATLGLVWAGYLSLPTTRGRVVVRALTAATTSWVALWLGWAAISMPYAGIGSLALAFRLAVEFSPAIVFFALQLTVAALLYARLTRSSQAGSPSRTPHGDGASAT